MHVGDSEGRRRPRQERAKTTVDVILEAGARVIEAGFARATTSRIAHVAGVSIGSLYQYFPGKEALFSALIERQAEGDVLALRHALCEARAAPFEERLVRAFDAGFAPILARPRLYVWIFTHLPALGLLPVARELERRIASELGELGQELASAVPGLDTQAMLLAGIGAARGALITLAHHRPDVFDQPAALRAAMIEAMLACVRHLQTRAPTGPLAVEHSLSQPISGSASSQPLP